MLVSAGCGRTGVLCAVDYVRQLLLTQVRCHLLLCAACPTSAYQGLFTLTLPLSVPDNPTQFQPLRCGPRDAETASCCSADRGVCVPRLPIPPPRPSPGHGEASVFSLLSDHSPQQEQYRFLYHTVAQLFSRTLQNTSPHRQKLKEVRGAPNFTLSATNTLNTPENSNGLTVPGPWPPQDCFLGLSPHKLISALTVTSMTSRPSPPALL